MFDSDAAELCHCGRPHDGPGCGNCDVCQFCHQRVRGDVFDNHAWRHTKELGLAYRPYVAPPAPRLSLREIRPDPKYKDPLVLPGQLGLFD